MLRSVFYMIHCLIYAFFSNNKAAYIPFAMIINVIKHWPQMEINSTIKILTTTVGIIFVIIMTKKIANTLYVSFIKVCIVT